MAIKTKRILKRKKTKEFNRKQKKPYKVILFGDFPQILILLLIILFIFSAIIGKIGIFSNNLYLNEQNYLIINQDIENAVKLAPSVTKSYKDSAISITPQEKYSGFCINAPVLMYHHIKPMEKAREEGHSNLTVDSNAFENHVKYILDQNYNILSGKELIDLLANKKRPEGKSILITIDDGYDDIYTYAFPVIKKYNVKVNIMIPTGFMGGSGYLNWNQLKEMTDSGFVYVYDHTNSHYSLPNGSPEKIKNEIMKARNILEEKLGKTVDIFAYPYGTWDQKSIDILTQNGFSGAFSTDPGFIQCDSFIMRLHRNRVGSAPLSSYGL